MTADAYITSNEKTLSGVLTLVMHLLFFALLVSGVTWQQRQPEAVVVDLWNNLPPLPAPKPAPEVKPPPAPKVEAKPVAKPDIAFKEKKEKERKAREQEAAEKKKRQEDLARLAALKQQQAKEAEAKRLAREQDEALRKLAAQQAAAQAKLIDEYKRRIAERIKRFIVEPPNLQGNPEVEFDVVLLPGGEVLGVKLKKGSTIAAWDNAVERAILKAQPLPLPPPDQGLFKDFRELNLKFRPKE
jgi:colicin import membrane protein